MLMEPAKVVWPIVLAFAMDPFSRKVFAGDVDMKWYKAASAIVEKEAGRLFDVAHPVRSDDNPM